MVGRKEKGTLCLERVMELGGLGHKEDVAVVGSPL